MVNDSISKPENVTALKIKIFEYTQDVKFKRCKNMGEIVKNALAFVKRNFENVNPKDI
jgi:hypothetical protein